MYSRLFMEGLALPGTRQKHVNALQYLSESISLPMPTPGSRQKPTEIGRIRPEPDAYGLAVPRIWPGRSVSLEAKDVPNL
jgi:hypothetical protein